MEKAESSNKTIINTLKMRLDKAKGTWADELLGVLWSYRSIVHSSTRETIFSLAFRTEVVILFEGSVPSSCYQWLGEESNMQLMNHSLDIIDELREHALI